MKGLIAVEDQIFADGIGTISVIGGTVRLDFVAYSPTEKDANGQPAAVFRQRIIMGMEAFLHSAEKIHDAAQTLAGRSPPSEPAPITTASSTPRAPEPTPEPAPTPLVKPPFP